MGAQAIDAMCRRTFIGITTGAFHDVWLYVEKKNPGSLATMARALARYTRLVITL